MARRPPPFGGQAGDPVVERALRALRREVEDLTRRLRKAEKTKHLPRTAEIALSADQGSVSVGTVVAFDEITGKLKDDGLVKLASDGTIALKAGHRYEIQTSIEATQTSANGAGIFEWRNAGSAFETDAGVAPRRHVTLGNTTANNSNTCPESVFIFTPSTEATLTLEVTADVNLTVVEIGTRVIITEVAK